MNCPICNSDKFDLRYSFAWGKVLQCSNCTCAYTDECDPDEMNKEAFDKQSNWEEIDLYRLWASQRLNTLKQFIRTGTLLEYGPGTGEFLYMSAQAGFQVAGMDRYPCLRRENTHPRISMIQADARTFRAEKPYDVVAALHVLEHFRNPYEMLSSVRANLSSEGYFLIEVPNYASLSRVVAGQRWRCFVGYHALHFTPQSLQHVLERAGFHILHLETVGCSTAHLLEFGVPFVLRRLKLPAPRNWHPSERIQRVAVKIEAPRLWGSNIRVVASKA